MRDLWTGRESPSRVWGFVDRLVDEPWSRWRAKLLGGPAHWREHVGWGPSEYLAASEVDAVQVNTAVTAVAGSGKRPRKTTPTWRPTRFVPLSADEMEAEGILPGDEFWDGEEDEEDPPN